MTTEWRVYDMDLPNLQVWLRPVNPGPSSAVRVVGYHNFVRTTRSNPQWGDVVDLDGEGNILGLSLENVNG